MQTLEPEKIFPCLSPNRKPLVKKDDTPSNSRGRVKGKRSRFDEAPPLQVFASSLIGEKPRYSDDMQTLEPEKFFPGPEYFFPSLPPRRKPLYIEDDSPSRSRGRGRGKSRLDEAPPLKVLAGSLIGEKPRYSDDMQTSIKPIKKGECFDVISLLSTKDLSSNNNYLVRNNGDRVEVESLRGKYILLCCFFVPSFWYSGNLWAMSLTSSELSVRDDFEMVVVVKMRRDWANDEAAFNRFVSSFSCLAVPFSDSHRCDYICMSLNFNCNRPLGFLVDPNQKVLQDNISFLQKVGASSFPFTDERLLLYDKESLKGQSLETLLCCNPSDFLCNNGSEKVFISQLNEKLVGLYLCSSGRDIPVLEKVYQQCRAQGLEFEIVMVYIPFPVFRSQELLKEFINGDLERRKIVSWWVLPFNNSVSRRLKKLSNLCLDDRVIIVGPRGKFVDPRAGKFIRRFGIDGYPFARDGVIEGEVERLRQLTLESLLGGGYVYRGNNDSDRVCVSELQGRNVLLYLGFAQAFLSFIDSLVKWYDQIKEKDPDLEVVFVCLDKSLSNSGYRCLAFMPWFVRPFSSSHSEFLAKKLFLWDSVEESLVAFGRDGRIRSIHAEHLLGFHEPFIAFGRDGRIRSIHAERLLGFQGPMAFQTTYNIPSGILPEVGPDAFPFSDNLREEVTRNF